MAEELPADKAGEVAMAAKLAAKAREAASKTASKTVADGDAVAAKAAAAAALDAAKYDEMVAVHKRRLAESNLNVAKTTVKLAKAVPLVAGLVQQLPELAPKAEPFLIPGPPLLESFFSRPVR